MKGAGLVGAFSLFVALAGLWTMPPLDRDEARFAQATAQMLESGDFVTIRFQTEERNKKPAGVHWLQAASVAALSRVETRDIWAYRVPSVLGATLAAMLAFAIGRRLYGARVGALAGVLLAAAPILAAEATIAKTDGALLALVCLAQWALIEIYAAAREERPRGWTWPLVFWLAQGAGVLVKGPIAPLVSALTLAAIALADKTARLSLLRRMRPLTGALVLVAVVAPWAIAVNEATEGRFFVEALGGDMMAKIGAAQESHAGPPGYHLLLAPALFWPAAALLGPGLMTAWRERGDWRARALLAWIAPAWIVFELTATKLPHYVLPLYPALAIFAARAAIDGPPPAHGARLRAVGALVYVGVGAVAAGLIVAAPARFAEDGAPLAVWLAAFVVVAAAFAAATLFWRRRLERGAYVAAGASALFAWSLMSLSLPQSTALALSPRLSAALDAAALHPIRDGAAPVALVGYSEPSAIFLLGTDSLIAGPAAAARALIDGAVGAAVVEERLRADFLSSLSAAGASAQAVTAIDGLNYSNGDETLLTIYAPASAETRGPR